MPDLDFEIVNVESLRDVANPALSFHVKIANRASQQPVHAILLRCQIQIEAPRRRYSSEEQEELRDLFGEPERWAQTLRPMLWANVTVNIPSFADSTIYPVSVPCTFDLAVASSKYFHAVKGGTVPITFLFSGTVFYDAGQAGLQVAPVPWNKEARFRFPVQVWKEMMDIHYPNQVWLSLQRDVFDALYRFKVKEGLPTFEESIKRLLVAAEHSLQMS